MDNVVNIEEIRLGIHAGVKYAQSEDFDKNAYEKNLEEAFEWAENAGLDPTVGNVYVLSVIASVRTMIGDELFNTPVVTEDGSFSAEKMEDTQRVMLEKMGITPELLNGTNELTE